MGLGYVYRVIDFVVELIGVVNVIEVTFVFKGIGRVRLIVYGDLIRLGGIYLTRMATSASMIRGFKDFVLVILNEGALFSSGRRLSGLQIASGRIIVLLGSSRGVIVVRIMFFTNVGYLAL